MALSELEREQLRIALEPIIAFADRHDLILQVTVRLDDSNTGEPVCDLTLYHPQPEDQI